MPAPRRRPFPLLARSAVALLGALALVAASAPGAAALPITDGIVAYYDFERSSGAVLPDVSGHGLDGALNNMNDADWVAGKYGNALDFDGVNDHVRIASGFTNTVRGDDTHTIAMWVYARSLASLPVLLDAEDAAYYDYFLELGSGANLAWVAIGGSTRQYGGGAVSTSAWHHFAYVKSGAGNSGTLYIDGAAQTSAGVTSSTPTIASDWLLGTFSSAKSATNFSLDGRIDDFAIWNRSLDATEIAALAGASSSPLGDPVPEPHALCLLALVLLGGRRLRRK